MTAFEFVVPGSVPSKGRPRMTRGGIVYTPKKTRLMEAEILDAFLRAYPGARPLVGPVDMEIFVHMKTNKSMSKKDRGLVEEGQLRPIKKPDLDNIIKAVFDALQGHAFENDAHVVSAVVKKHYSKSSSPEERTNIVIFQAIPDKP